MRKRELSSELEGGSSKCGGVDIWIVETMEWPEGEQF